MQAIAIRSEFASALALASRVVAKKHYTPILANIALVESGGVLTVRGTDLDKELTVALPGSPVDSGFATTVPAHAIREAEKKAPDASEIEIETITQDDEIDRTRFRFGKLSLAMASLPFADYEPVDMSAPIHWDFTLSRSDLLAMLDKVEFAVSSEETRYYLNGIFMHRDGDSLAFVATDGHRLALHKVPAPAGTDEVMPGVIIPRATLATLRDLCKTKGIGDTFRIEVNSVKVRFTVGNVTLVSKMIEGTFPDYSRVIPCRNDKSLTVNRDEAVEAIKAVSIIASERGKAFRLTLDTGKATFEVHNPDTGKASQEIGAEWTSEPGFQIGFNASYALDILARADGDAVTFKLADAGSPVRIDHDSGGFVLMPIRV